MILGAILFTFTWKQVLLCILGLPSEVLTKTGLDCAVKILQG